MILHLKENFGNWFGPSVFNLFSRTNALKEFELYPPPTNSPLQVAALSQPALPAFDELYEYYDPDTDPIPPPRLQAATPLSQRRPQSSSSGSAKSLRRTRRLQERRTQPRQPLVTAVRKSPKSTVNPRPPVVTQPAERSPRISENPFEKSGSTTPKSFRRIVSQEDFWPQRTNLISRRTHEAILFALEAIRIGRGKDAKPLTADTIEENARMSDLSAGPQASSSGRYQNGTSAAGRGPVAVPTDPPRGVRTPTEVMRARRERDARRKAEQEAAEQARREQEAQQTATQDSPIAQRRPSGRLTGQAQQDAERRASTGQTTGVGGRPRTSTVDQGQPRPVVQQPTTSAPQSSQYGQQAPQDPTADFSSPQAQQASDPLPQPPIPPVSQTTAQQSGRSGFPHAFERWETLSSHWEGLTAYWVRRLEENSNELNDRPINQQMARQITDLSAAGANLFHAVVELQRLRASSERKFQRWYFEWKQDQERAQETQAELERQLRAERDEKAVALASLAAAKPQPDRELSEMRRELQISKEEARRAWEELGRREQEERERTISLRSGEPTLVGGVQVVPMTQGIPSRQTSTANRPNTRDGQYGGGLGSTTLPSQGISRSQTNTTLDSPEDEQRRFTYEPVASSPTETDPFTETAHQSRSLHHERDVEFRRPTQPATSSAAMTTPRAAQVPTAPSRTTTTSSSIAPSGHYVQASTTNGSTSGTSRFYHQTPAELNLVRSTTSTAELATLYPTAASDLSYIPSTESGMSDPGAEDEYEINPDGSYRRDAAGRRILYQGGIPGQSDDGSDELDVASDLARERAYRERYGAPAGASTLPPTSTYAPVTTSTAVPPASSAADYSGQGWADEYDNSGGAAVGGTPRHRHPTRLSDILEERSGMTSPSRGSYISGAGDGSGAHPSSRAPGTR